MFVHELMTPTPVTCAPGDSLGRAAGLLWEHDVGALPVVREGRTVGMITDRDICMAAYTQGRPVWELPVEGAMQKAVVAVGPAETADDVLGAMRRRQVRRVPVVAEDGQLLGIISMNDLIRHAAGGELRPTEVLDALAVIGAPRTETAVVEAYLRSEREAGGSTRPAAPLEAR